MFMLKVVYLWETYPGAVCRLPPQCVVFEIWRGAKKAPAQNRAFQSPPGIGLRVVGTIIPGIQNRAQHVHTCSGTPAIIHQYALPNGCPTEGRILAILTFKTHPLRLTPLNPRPRRTMHPTTPCLAYHDRSCSMVPSTLCWRTWCCNPFSFRWWYPLRQ